MTDHAATARHYLRVLAEAKAEAYAPRFNVGDRVRDRKWGHVYTVTTADHRIDTTTGPVFSMTLRGGTDRRGRTVEHYDSPDRFDLAPPCGKDSGPMTAAKGCRSCGCWSPR